MNWAEIIKALKNLTASRFYFVVTLLFFLTLGYIYQEAVTIAVKEVTFNPVEFRECRDLKGLEDALNGINKKYEFIDSYAVYLYQPKEQSYYKKMVVTNSNIIKRTATLQGSYLDDQPTFNQLLVENDYFLIEKGAREQDTKFMEQLNIECLFVYKLHKKDAIGEVVVIMKRKPNPLELEALIKEISPLLHVYII